MNNNQTQQQDPADLRNALDELTHEAHPETVENLKDLRRYLVTAPAALVKEQLDASLAERIIAIAHAGTHDPT
jgi:hypothetical protein